MNRFIWALVAILILLLPFKVWLHYATLDTVQSIIQDKERVNDGNESRYLIFTDSETFTNEDSWLALKFNSSDVYGGIGIGQTCDFKVTGIRVPIFSWYRNILSASCS